MKHLIGSFFTIFVLCFLLSSCEETINLNLKDHAGQVVIEGLVSTIPGKQYVKVTQSTGFYDQGQSPRVTNAIVLVQDDLGNVHSFQHNPRQHVDSAGYYIPMDGLTGQVGRTYSLTVTAGEKIYTAQDRLFNIIAIDSLKTRVNSTEEKEPQTVGKFTEVLLYAHENPNEVNYYLFKFYRNDSLKYYYDTDIYYSDDKYIAENIDGIASPVFYGRNDLARVEMYSISQQAYTFYSDLSLLMNSDGGLFSQPPARPRNNLSNGAWGFFQASAISSFEIKIE